MKKKSFQPDPLLERISSFFVDPWECLRVVPDVTWAQSRNIKDKNHIK